MMLVADILHSCTDEGVAAAAVASIGGAFAAAVEAEAARLGLTVGAATASLVARFAIEASERDWRELTLAIAGEDHPVLHGLRTIVERMIARRAASPVRLHPRREVAASSRPPRRAAPAP